MSVDMMNGNIVWHDLHTHDVAGARRFYGALFGWTYTVEHSTDFAWSGGEANYILILAGGQAHGGFVETGADGPARWLAFVGVDDVDAVTSLAVSVGGRVEKPPFDIPGVGRCSVLRDPEGAVICPFVATHGYAPPANVFVGEVFPGGNSAKLLGFYNALFGWKATTTPARSSTICLRFHTREGALIAITLPHRPLKDVQTGWLPLIATPEASACVKRAVSLGATAILPVTAVENIGEVAVITDPAGASFGILQSR